MKKILFFLIFISFACKAEDSILLHRAFVSASTNWSPNQNLNYSLEAGTWGMKSNTSFSGTFDIGFDHGKASEWLGGKAYYTIHSEDKLCYMVYVAPKFSLNDKNGQLIEFGVNNNYTVSKDFLLGVTLGEQYQDQNNHNLFLSIGIVYLFRK